VRKRRVIAAGIACAALAAGAAACSSSPQAPPTARQVAGMVAASGFTDCGPHPAGGVTDSGTAILDGFRVGIDTFPGTAQLTAWEQAAADLGVVPWHQGSTWVVYKAVTQAGGGCQ
jgi:hypothetical protein